MIQQQTAHLAYAYQYHQAEGKRVPDRDVPRGYVLITRYVTALCRAI